MWLGMPFANPLSRIIQCLDSAGFNFDVASKGELEQVLTQGIDSERVFHSLQES